MATLFLFREKLQNRDIWVPFLRGCLIALAGIIVLLLVNNGYKWTFTKTNIYFYSVLFYIFIPILIAQAAFLLFTLFVQYKPLANSELQYISYLSGYFTILSFGMFLVKSGDIDAYLLFYQPFIHLALIASIPVISLYVLDMYSGVPGYIMFGLTPCIGFVLGFIPFFYYINYPLFSVLLTAVALGGGGTAYYFLGKN